MSAALGELDRALIEALHGQLAGLWGPLRAPLDLVMVLASRPLAWLGLVAGAWLVSDRPPARIVAAGLVWALLGAAVTDALCSYALRPLVVRARPCEPTQDRERLRLLRECPPSGSFPSNHGADAMCVAAVLFGLFGRRAGWSWVAALVVAASGPYVGSHYVSDEVAGAVVGVAIGAATAWAAREYGGADALDRN